MVVPGTGDIMNGVVTAGQNGVSKYLRPFQPPQWGPRFGVAWDITGRQQFVIRTGFGIFYDRTSVGIISGQYTSPPLPTQTTLQYGYASQLGTPGQQPLISPQSLRSIDGAGDIPTRYSFNFGVQSKLPWGMVLDTSYVGGLMRHLLSTRQLNNVPYGAAYLPENQDLTKSASATPGGRAYDQAYLRAPYSNYGAVSALAPALSANYNGLQVSLNRRLAEALFFGANYTWSKSLGVSSLRIDGNSRNANYSYYGTHRKHNFTAHFVYSLPRMFRSSGLLHGIADGWQISGITIFQSGAPLSVGYSIPGVSSVNLTGSTSEGARIALTGSKPETGKDDPYARINAAAFTAPKPNSIGMESGSHHLFGPGINNWNLSVQKTFAFKERYRLRLRFDSFNTFNHTQFSGYNSTLNFTSLTNSTVTNLPYDSSGNLVWAQRNGFGTVSGARDARVLQLYVRLQF